MCDCVRDLYVWLVPQWYTNASDCCHPQPTVKLSPAFHSDIEFHGNLPCFLIISLHNPPSSLPFGSLYVAWLVFVLSLFPLVCLHPSLRLPPPLFTVVLLIAN